MLYRMKVEKEFNHYVSTQWEEECVNECYEKHPDLQEDAFEDALVDIKEEKIYPFKIHVSLDFKDFKQHADELDKIILKYIDDIGGFKRVLPDSLEKSITTTQNQINQLKELSDISRLAWFLGTSRVVTPAEKASIQKEKDKLASMVRFRDGDQITIYLLKTISHHVLFNLCWEIEDYININGLSSGKTTEFASSITPAINFRQDRLNGQYVCALRYSDDSAEEDQKRNELKKLQENNLIYLYLKNKFETTLVSHSDMWARAPEKTLHTTIGPDITSKREMKPSP